MADETIVQLAHVAGLTAGKTMPLIPGTYEFGPNDADDEGLGMGDPTSVSFILEVRRTGEVVLTPGQIAVSIEGQRVSSPVNIVPGHTIQAGADHFVLLAPTEAAGAGRRPMAPTSPITIRAAEVDDAGRRRGTLLLAIALIVVGVLLGLLVDELWYLLAGLGIVLGVVGWLARSRRLRRAEARREASVQEAKADLASSLMKRRIAVAQERRSEVAGPAELLGGATLTPSSALAIGAGDTEWTPRVGRSDGIGWDPHPIIDDYSSVSSVPFTVDHEAGPVALCGPRSATLAVARYLTVAAMHHFGPEEVTLSSDDDAAWAWADDSVRRGSHGFVIVDRDDPEVPAQGIIVLDADQPIPTGVDRVVRVTENDIAHASDEEGRLLAADLVPYGLTAPAATAAAATVVSQHEEKRRIRAAKAERDEANRKAREEAKKAAAESRRAAEAKASETAKAARAARQARAARAAASAGATATPSANAFRDSPTLSTDATDLHDDTALLESDITPLDSEAAPIAVAPLASTPAAPSTRPVDGVAAGEADPADLDAESSAAGDGDGDEDIDASPLEELTPGNATVLFTVDDAAIGRELVASVAIDMAHRRGPGELAVGIIDSAERGLIRLKQLPHCVGYAALDDPTGIDDVLTIVESHTDGHREIGESDAMVLVISDLVPLIDHLHATGRADDARRLIRAASNSDDQRLIIAAANSSTAEIHVDFDACVTSRVDYTSDGDARIVDANGERPLPSTDFSARDLTGAVAAIKHGPAPAIN